ncbi:hypothetical protein KGY77_08490 [Candidatus Bipolaricaulota bacterium]|nr:hypothetical protein [Candidatus Bipolaricaulota bacterium]
MKKLSVLLVVLLALSLPFMSFAASTDSMEVVSDGDESPYSATLSFTPGLWVDITGASWIWTKDSKEIPEVTQETFRESFKIKGIPTFGEIEITADNFYKVYLNGRLVGQKYDSDTRTFERTYTHTVTSYLKPGNNELKVIGINDSLDGRNTSPAGVIYNLNIDYKLGGKWAERCDNGVGNGSENCTPGEAPENDEGENTGPGNPGNKGGA